MTIDLLENPANGIGDAVLFAWLSLAAHRAGRELPLYMTRHHDWLAVMPDVLPLMSHKPGGFTRKRDGEWKRLTGREKELRNAGQARHRLEAWAKAYWLDGLEFEAPTIAIDQRDAEFADQWWTKAMDHCPQNAGAPKVLVFSNCAWAQRSWPQAYWVDLAGAANAAGLQTVVMTRDGKEQDVCQYPFAVYGTTPGQCWAMIEQADIVVAADTGPAHLAVTAGKPTVVLQGPTRSEWVFGHAIEHVTAVDSGEAVACTGCDLEKEKGFRAACQHGCQSLFALTPAMALKAVLGVAEREAVSA